MWQFIIAVLIIGLTVFAYLGAVQLYRRYSVPFLMPILTTSVAIIVVLVLFHVPYSDYMIGGKWINALLGPCVVALAYPLYNQRKALREYALPIAAGVLSGLIMGMLSGVLLAKLAGLDRNLILSILPKSITTPVAIQISAGLGGVSAMTVVFVMVAGFTGAILGPSILRMMRIDSLLGKGIALGSASHALGLSKAVEFGELTVSMGSVSMTMSAILGSVIGPVVVWLLQL
ncbi:LrgB family protein [Paenibacillus sp. JX-17]|uniref:LrgB family protein n=1 Tax=Paenibacillus lacisoli TaxID=3064525 RepID=A0ABT9CI48_9BACL|nr:LrgB family protein [Paenibacillus sp. JX-17]MDO7908304.1 LrgB family protein [Paenibacillus sp. JX-17]